MCAWLLRELVSSNKKWEAQKRSNTSNMNRRNELRKFTWTPETSHATPEDARWYNRCSALTIRARKNPWKKRVEGNVWSAQEVDLSSLSKIVKQLVRVWSRMRFPNFLFLAHFQVVATLVALLASRFSRNCLPHWKKTAKHNMLQFQLQRRTIPDEFFPETSEQPVLVFENKILDLISFSDKLWLNPRLKSDLVLFRQILKKNVSSETDDVWLNPQAKKPTWDLLSEKKAIRQTWRTTLNGPDHQTFRGWRSSWQKDNWTPKSRRGIQLSMSLSKCSKSCLNYVIGDQ